MRRFPTALGATALASATLLAPSASGRVQHLTLRYLAVQTSSREINRGARGIGPGDSFAFTEKLLVRRGVAGSDRVRCDVLSRTRFFCRGRLFFREGTIAVRGVISATTGHPSLPITGGTGVFRGQRGRVRVGDAPHGHSSLRLTLR